MSLRGVVRILRLPLFITAAADSVAGYLVGMAPDLSHFRWESVALLAGTSSGLYLFGMVANDLADVQRDRLLNVPRPLVTGQIRRGAALALLALTLGLTVACASRLTGGAMFAAILAFLCINLYNLGAKHGPVYVAMSAMGLCRLFNYAMGVAAATEFPHHLTAVLPSPSGPLWVWHAVALFCITAILTGYSICARDKIAVSSRPWAVGFAAAAVGGFALIVLSVIESPSPLRAPIARTFAALVLPMLWPGGLWSAAGPQRKPEEYAPFIHRAIYWMMLMDAAFVGDALLR